MSWVVGVARFRVGVGQGTLVKEFLILLGRQLSRSHLEPGSQGSRGVWATFALFVFLSLVAWLKLRLQVIPKGPPQLGS